MTKYHKLKLGDRIMRIENWSKSPSYGTVIEIKKEIHTKFDKDNKPWVTTRIYYLVDMHYNNNYNQKYWFDRNHLIHLNDEEYLVESL
jgi:hypothetical protein